jgi:hypothetical protein
VTGMKNNVFAPISEFASTRRQLLGFGLVLAGAAAVNLAPGFQLLASAQAAVPSAAQKIADHFSSVKSMTGEFVQFGPKGEQSGGKFFLERPGKIRFNYDGASNFKVISDGRSVIILNKKLNTSDLYPLSKTPLKLLLDTKIDLSGDRVKSVQVGFRQFQNHHDVRSEILRIAPVDHHRRTGQGHDGDDLQRQGRRQFRRRYLCHRLQGEPRGQNHDPLTPSMGLAMWRHRRMSSPSSTRRAASIVS